MTHHLDKIFSRYGFNHPTWCRLIIMRIARRRWVSVSEIKSRIIPWYSRKYRYRVDVLLRHSGIDAIPCDSGFPWAMRGDEWGPFCALPHRAHRYWEKTCFTCGAILPAGGALPFCGDTRCADIQAWWHAVGHRAARHKPLGPELMGLKALTEYLTWLTKQQQTFGKPCSKQLKTSVAAKLRRAKRWLYQNSQPRSSRQQIWS